MGGLRPPFISARESIARSYFLFLASTTSLYGCDGGRCAPRDHPLSLTTMGINHESVRQKLESTMFVKLNSSDHPYEEHYVAHIKVWEAAQDSKGKKSRYIVLSRTSCWSS